ncbi:MFS transporter [Halobacteria archaeon AArc-m2/3/4]|uniref:MFS transporter n=1 Tax=Natronoglomus mannanivorans TaxID=2979990 RepID=A0ABT2Q8J0_9EURY|nr:MFS transporter [Halobacteria archaeon AArc-m2/3/4]
MSVTSTIRGLTRFDALALTALIWFLAKFLRYAFPPLFEPLQGAYGVSNTVIGAAFTGFMLVYALMQFPSGLLADRLGSVIVITAGALLAAVAAFVVVLEPPFAFLVGAMMLMGAGTGAHKTVAIRLLSRTYPARTGRALGVLDTVGTFGGVAAPAAVVAVASVPLLFDPGWRTLFFAAGLVGIGLAAAFAIQVPKRLPGEASTITEVDAESGSKTGAGTETEIETDSVEPAAGNSSAGVQRYLELFREWRFSVFVVVTILFSFTYNGVVAFFPLYLVQEAGLDGTTAGLLYSVLFALSLVQLVTGEVSDRIGKLPVIVATQGLATVSLAAFVLLTGTGGPLVLGATIVAVGIGSHGFRPVRGSYLMSVLPTSIAGGSLGIVRTLLMGAGAISPTVVGYLSETVGFRPAFWLLTASIALATALSAVLLVLEPGRTTSE